MQGLAPTDSLQLAKAEMIMDKILEIENAFIWSIIEPDPARKVSIKKTINSYVFLTWRSIFVSAYKLTRSSTRGMGCGMPPPPPTKGFLHHSLTNNLDFKAHS